MTRGGLFTFVARRILVLAVLLVVVSFAVFSLLYMAPGSAAQSVLIAKFGPYAHDAEQARAVEREFHLDKPFFTQYWIWARHAAQLNFGTSFKTSLPVRDEIGARLPTSLFLATYAYILTMVFGCGLGIVAALRRRSTLDRVVVGGAMVGLCTPAFVTGVFLLYLLAIKVHWFPIFGIGRGFFDKIWHLTLPAVTLALATSAFVLTHTRAAIINVLEQDYLTFARARGLSAQRIMFTYALRNAVIPVITIAVLTMSALITGAVLVETTFSVSGIAGLLVQSANTKDLPMLQGVALLFAGVIMLANLVADLAYFAADPRIRLGHGSM